MKKIVLYVNSGVYYYNNYFTIYMAKGTLKMVRHFRALINPGVFRKRFGYIYTCRER